MPWKVEVYVSKKRVCHIKGSESSESAFLYRYFVYILIKCGADEFNLLPLIATDL